VLLDVPLFCVDFKQFIYLKLHIEAVLIARKLEVCMHSLTIELMQIDEASLFIGFGHGKRFFEVS
jgi:hypothetical protein